MDIGVKFIAKSTSAILVLGGIVGWLLCGFNSKEIFCDNWKFLLAAGIGLTVLSLFFWYGAKIEEGQ